MLNKLLNFFDKNRASRLAIKHRLRPFSDMHVHAPASYESEN